MIPAPDPVAFCETVLVNPETGRPFALTPAERAFVQHAFELTSEGRLRYPELVFSGPKKSGKTGFAGMLILYVVRALGGRFAEGYCAANDFEQSQGRVFQAAARIVTASPLLAADAVVTANKIEFRSTGATITAIANDYAGAAGANPTVSCFDELWGYTSERARRLWDEMVPPPTRSIACRLTVTYAGFLGESELLEELYKRGIAGEQVAPDLYAAGGLLLFWTHDFTAPWQTETWREQMREQLRPNAYLRLIENQWVTSESPFIDMAWWDACTDPEAAPLLANHDLSVWVGIDASVKRDSTAIVACAWDASAQKVRLVFHRIFQPSPDSPLDFEATVEATVRELARRFRPIAIRYDPYQMQASAQRLQADNLPMVEFAQTQSNLTEASSNLYELVKGRNIVVYPDDAIRLAVQRSIAVETSRGWRIAKEKASHKIDVVVALAQAALGAVHTITAPPTLWAPSALLAADRPVPWPSRAELVFATLLADERGCAVLFWAVARGGALLLIDYQQAPFSPDLFAQVRDRLHALADVAGARGFRCFTTAAFAGQIRAAFEAHALALVMSGNIAAARAADLPTEPIADALLTPAAREPLLLAAAAEIGAGRVKIAQPAAERAQKTPLPLADLRPGTPSSALVDAAILGICTILAPTALPRPPAAPRANPHGATAGLAAAR